MSPPPPQHVHPVDPTYRLSIPESQIQLFSEPGLRNTQNIHILLEKEGFNLVPLATYAMRIPICQFYGLAPAPHSILNV